MRCSDAELRRLAEDVVRAVLKQGLVHPKVAEAKLAERIHRLLLDNMKEEADLEAEAERLAQQHTRQMAGMDQRKVIDGIKARLAKERGFSL
jgi:hypothetical protein